MEDTRERSRTTINPARNGNIKKLEQQPPPIKRTIPNRTSILKVKEVQKSLREIESCSEIKEKNTLGTSNLSKESLNQVTIESKTSIILDEKNNPPDSECK